MADYRDSAAFLFPQEGHTLIDQRTDAGGLTMCGITFSVWLSYFPETNVSGETLSRFKAMNSADWYKIFKSEFWDKFHGDDIKSSRIANEISEWVFNSGKYYPERDIQELINLIFNKHIGVDGCFGKETIDTINSLPEEELYNDILKRHADYYRSLCAGDIAIIKQKYPDVSDETIMARLATQEGLKNLPNLRGWLNRIDNMKNYNLKYKANS